MSSDQDRRIEIHESAIGSTIVSGDGNQVVIYLSQFDRQPAVATAEPTAVSMGPNPYRGLLAFQETDGDRFFGRQVETEAAWQRLRDLYEMVGAVRLLPIYGPSGSGKSSLARAGLVPALARQPLPGLAQMQVAVLVPGSRPLDALAAVLARMITQEVAPIAKTRECREELARVNGAGVYDGLSRIAALLPGIHQSPLLVLVDQFEEVYSLCEDAGERRAFVRNLIEAAADRSRQVLVVVTLRSDFLGETQRETQLNQLFASQGVLVPAMGEAALREAIQEPARRAGQPLDAATVALLIEQTEGREGALPLLQFALTRIWVGMGQGVTPGETLAQMGGVGGALAGEAQRVYEGLSERQQAIARRVFLGLVHLGEGTRDTRRRVMLSELRAQRDTEGDFRVVLDRFAQPGVRLLTLSAEAAGVETAAVTHEALFEHWQALQEWLNKGREDLRFQQRFQAAAVDWDTGGRPVGRLWREPDVSLLQRYYQRAGEEFTTLQLAFLRASQGAKRRQQWFQRLGIMGLVGITVLMSYQVWLSERRRMGQYEATAKLLVETDPVGSLNNALAAVGMGKSLRLRFPEVWQSNLVSEALLVDPIQAIPNYQLIEGHEGMVWSVAFSPDGQTIASGSADGTVRLWSLQGEELAKFQGHEAWVLSVAFSPDGQTIASGSDDRTIILWKDLNSSLIAMACRRIKKQNPPTDVKKAAVKTCKRYGQPRRLPVLPSSTLTP